MAVIDSSMYLQQQAPDLVGSISQGLKAKDMIRQQRLQSQDDDYASKMRNAYMADPATGQLVFDKSKMPELTGLNGQKTYELQKQQAADAHALKKQKHEENLAYVEEAAPIVLSMTDPQSHANGLKMLTAAGNPVAKELPPEYDPNFMKSYQAKVTPIAQHFAQKKEEGDMLKAGYVRDPAGNGWVQAAGGAAEQAQNKNTAEIKHLEALAEKERATAAHAGDYKKVTANNALERQDNLIHSRVVNNLQKNPVLQQKLTQYQNLSSALSNFENAEHPTPQAFDELQQAVRANLGIKGASAVGEREHTTMNSLGLNGSRMMQFLTGNPADIAKDAGFAKHMKDLVHLERQNIDKQVGNHLSTLTAGHASMYKRRPELLSDLQDASNAYRSEFTGGQTPSAASGGFQPHPQDNVAVAWAQANLGGDPATAAKAQAILKANGAQ